MKLWHLLLLSAATFIAGCDHQDSHEGHDHPAEQAHRKPCGFKEGRGVFVGEETRRIIGLAVADVTARGSGALPAVPESSLLSTATGDFVFTVNGDHFLRTEVKPAGHAGGFITVADGLLEGDQVVTNGVRELWRIELQATKGGAACAH